MPEQSMQKYIYSIKQKNIYFRKIHQNFTNSVNKYIVWGATRTAGFLSVEKVIMNYKIMTVDYIYKKKKSS